MNQFIVLPAIALTSSNMAKQLRVNSDINVAILNALVIALF